MDFPKNYYGYANTLPLQDSRVPVYQEQLRERGYDDTETWSFDDILVKFIAPRLRLYRELASKHIVIDGEFEKALDKMIDGFTLAESDEYNIHVDSDREKVDEAFELLAKWYKHLWW